MTHNHFYALSDTFTGDDPKYYNAGFCNTKIVIAFTSKKDRDDWVKNTKLLTAKSLSRKEAEELTSWEIADYYFRGYEKVKAVRIHGKDNHVILRKR